MLLRTLSWLPSSRSQHQRRRPPSATAGASHRTVRSALPPWAFSEGLLIDRADRCGLIGRGCCMIIRQVQRVSSAALSSRIRKAENLSDMVRVEILVHRRDLSVTQKEESMIVTVIDLAILELHAAGHR